MTFRAPPLPTEERARHTEQLIRDHASDVMRWTKLDSLATQWDSRAAMAARYIPAGQRVLDIGAGAMALRDQLAPGCSYFPADIVSRCQGCQVVDLNKGEFPAGTYDWLTFLGVLEYVHDPAKVLALAGATAPNMILTYCTMNGGEAQARRGMGWVTDFTVPEVEDLLARTRWYVLERVEVKRGPANIQYLFVAEAA